ncbi:aldo/keto reductase [Candidatus Poribacteria bacterium]|nr:aldo/keto reductase [Candidatus Poribacteria bacterium]
MRTRTFGRTGLSVSEVGFGGGRIRSTDDVPQCADVIRYAMDSGIDFLDTAPSYGDGSSERVIAEAVRGRRDQVVIATKTKSFIPTEIGNDVVGSLRRLRTDFVDVLQFHGGWFEEHEASAALDDGIDAFSRLRDEGKVRFFGFSADGPSAGVERMIASDEFDMIQTQYSLMYQSTSDGFTGEGIIPQAIEMGMGVATMRSTTSGTFGRLLAATGGSIRHGGDVEAFLLNYVLSNPFVHVALLSLQSREDVDRACRVSDDLALRLDLKALHGG